MTRAVEESPVGTPQRERGWRVVNKRGSEFLWLDSGSLFVSPSKDGVAGGRYFASGHSGGWSLALGTYGSISEAKAAAVESYRAFLLAELALLDAAERES